MNDSVFTTHRQRKLLRVISRDSLMVVSPISDDLKYLRDRGYIVYRGKRKPGEYDLGWYITDDGRQYLHNYSVMRRGSVKRAMMWLIGTAIAVAGVAATLVVGLGLYPKPKEEEDVKTEPERYTAADQNDSEEPIDPTVVYIVEPTVMPESVPKDMPVAAP